VSFDLVGVEDLGQFRDLDKRLAIV